MRKLINDKVKSSKLYKQIKNNEMYKEILKMYTVEQLELMLPFSSSSSSSSTPVVTIPGGVEGELWNLLPTVDTSSILHVTTFTDYLHRRTHLSYELSDNILIPSDVFKKQYATNLVNSKLIVKLREFNAPYNSNESTFVGVGLLPFINGDLINLGMNHSYLRRLGNADPLNSAWEVVHEGVAVYNVKLPASGDFYFRFSDNATTSFYEFSNLPNFGYTGLSFPKTIFHTDLRYTLFAKGGWIETNIISTGFIEMPAYYFDSNGINVFNLNAFTLGTNFFNSGPNLKNRLPFYALAAPTTTEVNNYRIGFVASNKNFDQESLEGVYVNGTVGSYDVGCNGSSLIVQSDNGFKSYILLYVSEYRFKIIVDIRIIDFYSSTYFESPLPIFSVTSAYNLKANSIRAYVRNNGPTGHIGCTESRFILSPERFFNGYSYSQLVNGEYMIGKINYGGSVLEIGRPYKINVLLSIGNGAGSPVWGTSAWGVGVGVSSVNTNPVGTSFDDYAIHASSGNGCCVMFRTQDTSFSIVNNSLINTPSAMSPIYGVPSGGIIGSHVLEIIITRTAATTFNIVLNVLFGQVTNVATFTFTKTFTNLYINVFKKEISGIPVSQTFGAYRLSLTH
jgi:hypothetical protein